METISLARRGFLRGQLKTAIPILRPPWALAEADFQSRCSRCDRCVSACPTQILFAADGGYPSIDFRRGECTFCGDCVRACADGALSLAQAQAPWHLQIAIDASCLAVQRIVCRSCADVCEALAIRFFAQAGGIALPELDTKACTGCGACINACPTQAIAVDPAAAGSNAT